MKIQLEPQGKNEIQIRAYGEEKSILLINIIFIIEKINTQYKFNRNINVFKLLQCKCQECISDSEPHFFKYTELKKYKEKGGKDYPCGKTGNLANIENVLSILHEDSISANEIQNQILYNLRDLKLGQKKLFNDNSIILSKQNITLEGIKEISSSFEIEKEALLNQIISLLSKVEQSSVKKIQKIIDITEYNKNDIQQLIEVINRSLSQIIQKVGSKDDLNKSNELLETIDTELDIKGKLKLTIPIIPVILKYEKELSWDLKSLFKQIRSDFEKGYIFTKP